MILRELLAVFGVQFDSSGLKQADSSIAGVVGQLKQLGALVAGSAVVRGVANFVGEMELAGAQVGDTANRLGVSTRALQQWEYIARRSGVQTESVGVGFRFLEKNAYDAAHGNTALAATFRRLGVQIKDPNGRIRDAGDLMNDTAAAIGGLQDPAEKTAIAMKIFGRSGAELNTIFNQGADGLAALRARFDELGGGFSDEFIQAAGRYDDQLDDLDLVMRGLKGTIATYLLPAFSWLVAKGTQLITGFQRLTKGTHFVQVGLVALAVVAGIAGLAVLAPFAEVIIVALLAAAAILAVTLVVDDLIALFTGGRSVIGRFLDKLFGVGTSKKFVTEVRAEWKHLVEQISKTAVRVARWYQETRASVQGVTDYLRSTWGPAWDAAGAYLSSVGTLASEVASIIKRVFSTTFNVLGTLWDALWGRFVSGAQSIAGMLGVPVGDDLQSALTGGVGGLARRGFAGAGAATANLLNAGAGANVRAAGAAHTLDQKVEVGQIIVQGATDPLLTARLVSKTLRSQQDENLRAAHAALTREAAG